MKTVSILLPATDETYSLKETIEQVTSVLPNYRLQLIIVTSPKLTTPECRDAIGQLKNSKYAENIETFDQIKPGVGGALQEAFTRAQGDYTVLMASDLETDPAVLPKMIEKLEGGYDVAATTRWRGGIRFSGYNPIKLVLNFCFQLGFRILYLTKLTDLTYAYRAYKTEVIKSIYWEDTGFPFLFETIVKPIRLGYRTIEISAPWKARTEGISHADWKQIIAYAKLGLYIRFLPIRKIRYNADHD